MEGLMQSASLRYEDSPRRKIAVLRALQLGDMLCAVPALRALRRRFPQSEIALIGLPWSALWAQRLPHVDRWFEFPGWPGLPEVTPNLRNIPAFLALMQECRFDLVLQLHGAGSIVNPIVASFAARNTAGFYRPGEYCPDPWRYVPWPEQGHEIERCLVLTDALDVPRAGTQLEFPVLPCDRSALAQNWPQLGIGSNCAPYVCVHPGAQYVSRRWPVERYAAVAQALSDAGYLVVMTGTREEHGLGEALASLLRPGSRLLDLIGRTSLWQLGALIEQARLVLANDTSVSHIAAALGTPSVIVSCGTDVERWAPLDGERHRVLAERPACRPCGFRICPSGHECATGVSVEAVQAAAFDQLAVRRPHAAAA